MWDQRLDCGHIYLITNNINNKKYIGQTWYPLERRLSQHKSQQKRGCPLLSKAINKYGKEAFTIESLIRFNNPTQADFLETYFISFYCSADPQLKHIFRPIRDWINWYFDSSYNREKV